MLGYDFIYIDYNNGMDDIYRNASFVVDAIRKINSLNAGSKKNIVMGYSMGGLVASIALKNMELSSEDHCTWKYISIDSPHRGANIPLGYQEAFNHIMSDELGLTFYLPICNISIHPEHFINTLSHSKSIFNSIAAQQMLAFNSNPSFQHVHNKFDSDYCKLGFPEKTVNVAISNGRSDNLRIHNPGTDLFRLNATYKLSSLIEFFNVVLGSAISPLFSFTNHPELLLNIVPGKTSISSSVSAKAARSGSSEIYYGKLSFRKKILWLMPVTVTITKRKKVSPYNMIPVDGAQGGSFHIQDSFDFGSLPSGLSLNYSLNREFTFIPTSSSLGISGDLWKTYVSKDFSQEDIVQSGITPFNSVRSNTMNDDHANCFSQSTFLINELLEEEFTMDQQPIIIGADVLKNEDSTTYHIKQAIPGVIYEWKVTDGITIVSQSESTCTVKPSSEKFVKNAIIVKCTYPKGQKKVFQHKLIWTGKPDINLLTIIQRSTVLSIEGARDKTIFLPELQIRWKGYGELDDIKWSKVSISASGSTVDGNPITKDKIDEVDNSGNFTYNNEDEFMALTQAIRFDDQTGIPYYSRLKHSGSNNQYGTVTDSLSIWTPDGPVYPTNPDEDEEIVNINDIEESILVNLIDGRNYYNVTPLVFLSNDTKEILLRLKIININGESSYSNPIRYIIQQTPVVSVYPNPCTHFISVKIYDGNHERKYKVELWDSNNLLNTHYITANEHIDVSSLQKGKYIVRVISDNAVSSEVIEKI